MSRYSDKITKILNDSKLEFNESVEIEEKSCLPPTGDYLMSTWYRIPDVVAVFIDMRNSTGLSATHHEKTTAKIYQFFTGTVIKILHELNAEYIDIKGDGVLALFSNENRYKALAATVTVKTYLYDEFLPKVRSKLNGKVDIGVHIGIDQKTVLVKSVGIRDNEGRDRRKNEVWAGKPINMASKLASIAGDKELVVSDRYYNNIKDCVYLVESCGCREDGTLDLTYGKKPLWVEREIIEKSKFDFAHTWVLEALWCKNHGDEYCNLITNFKK